MEDYLDLKDIVSFETFRQNPAQIILEVEHGDSYKVIIKDNLPTIVLVKAEEYRMVYEQLDEFGETSRAFSPVIRQGFRIRDILSEERLVQDFDQLFEEVAHGDSQKVLLKNDLQTVVLTKAEYYLEAEQRLTALEVEETIKEMKAEYARGELIDFDDLMEQWGIELPDDDEEPAGYDQMIPEEYRSV